MAAPRAPDAVDGALSGSARTRRAAVLKTCQADSLIFCASVDAEVVGGATCDTGQLGPDRVIGRSYCLRSGCPAGCG